MQETDIENEDEEERKRRPGTRKEKEQEKRTVEGGEESTNNIPCGHIRIEVRQHDHFSPLAAQREEEGLSQLERRNETWVQAYAHVCGFGRERDASKMTEAKNIEKIDRLACNRTGSFSSGVTSKHISNSCITPSSWMTSSSVHCDRPCSDRTSEQSADPVRSGS